MSIPQVSVVIPAYNVANYIEQALRSLENQSFKDFEALVVDDGSTDTTTEIVKTFCKRDPRFQLLSKLNGGLASARNHGIAHARSKYIALLDGDDLYGSDKLITHVARLDSDPQIGVVYSASQAIRLDGKSTFISLSGKPIYRDPLAALLCKNFIGHGSNGVFRKCIVDEIGVFDGTFIGCEDINFWLRIAATKKWHFYREPHVHCYYRVRPSGLSFDIEQMENSQTMVIEAAHQRSPKLVQPFLSQAYAYLYRYLARISLTAGDVDTAKKYIDRALSSDGSIFLKDPRSLLTFISVRLAPLSRLVISRSLGAARSEAH